jgi:hypothetical protein
LSALNAHSKLDRWRAEHHALMLLGLGTPVSGDCQNAWVCHPTLCSSQTSLSHYHWYWICRALHDKVSARLQADVRNLGNTLEVIDFGGLFSGNALGPSRQYNLRLVTTF